MVSAEEVPNAAEAEEAVLRMEEIHHVPVATQYTGDSTSGQQRKCMFG